MIDTRERGEAVLRDQIERMVHRTAAISALVEEYMAPLNTPAWILLRLLEAHGPSRASDLAASSRLSRPWVSRCLTSLEEGGLVVAAPDPRDGRASLVSITEQGARYMAHLADVGQQQLHELTDGFSTAEVVQLGTLLARLNDNADRHAVTPARYRLEGATR